MARKEVEETTVEENTDQGPYTGQSMDIPSSPFTPTPVDEEEVEVEDEE